MISKIISNSLRSHGLSFNIRKYFHLHEYQSKDLMRKYGIFVQKGHTATSPEEAFKVAK
jgi:succinyl-CoA synthetase beta subunit